MRQSIPNIEIRVAPVLMRQTLFTIPHQILGVPIFGLGLLLVLWIVGCAVMLWRRVRKDGFGPDARNSVPIMILVGLAIWGLPRLFPEGLPIRGYGVMVVLGVLAGMGLALWRAWEMGVCGEIISSLACWMLPAGVIGARLFHVVEYWESDYHRETALETLKAVLNVPQGGLVIYGALVGGIVGFLGFVVSRRLPALALADLFAPSLAVGLALGRVGCLLNGCCFGGRSELPWAVTFPHGSPPYQSQVARGEFMGLALSPQRASLPSLTRVDSNSPAHRQGLNPGDVLVRVNHTTVQTSGEAQQVIARAHVLRVPMRLETKNGRTIELPAQPVRPRSLPVHPTQLYSAISAWLLGLFLWSYFPFRRRDGEVIALLLTIYPAVRMVLEAIRVDEPAVFGTGLSISQNISLLMLAVVPLLWVYILRQPKGSAL